MILKTQFSVVYKCEFRLSWSHYLMLMRIDDMEERKFYEIETAENSWSLNNNTSCNARLSSLQKDA